MNNTHRRRRDRLARAVAYVSAHAADFPAESKGGQAAAEIADALAEVETHSTSRESSINALQQVTVSKQDARDSIRAHLRALSDTARIIGLDHPEVKGGFQFNGASVGDRTLLATARAVAAAAQPIKALFIEYDMPADFYEKFAAGIESFERQLNRQTAGRGERVAANASLDDALHRGEVALERLNTAVSNKHRDDPAKLAAWESARRLERAPRSKRNGGAPKEPETKE
jgi:uncharacterized coiled-coil protein SlyX